jgi:hypothetical protein
MWFAHARAGVVPATIPAQEVASVKVPADLGMTSGAKRNYMMEH